MKRRNNSICLLDFDEIFINKHETTLRIIHDNYFEDRTFENKFSKKE
jgi:hypothetical protein